MTKEHLQLYKERFIEYARSFYTTDADEQKNILLKEKHTFNVCQNIAEISKSLNLKEYEINLAESIALFHDIGRFEQLRKYKTFKDNISVNHGDLGADILSETKILERLPEREFKIILHSIKYHNALKMPDIKDDTLIFYLKLIRDADKLDIWRIFIAYFESSDDMGSAAGLGLPDTSGYNSELLSNIYSKKMVSLSKVVNLNDFKIMQISWVFDLNFKLSFKLFNERGYIRILSTLPQTDEIVKATGFIMEYLNYRINND